MKIRGALIQIGNKKINRNNWDWEQIEKNDLIVTEAIGGGPAWGAIVLRW